jgi:hypothetical protein
MRHFTILFIRYGCFNLSQRYQYSSLSYLRQPLPYVLPVHSFIAQEFLVLDLRLVHLDEPRL